MQLSNCNIFIDFNSLERMSMNFYCEIIFQFSKKRVRFVATINYFASNITFRLRISIMINSFKSTLFKINEDSISRIFLSILFNIRSQIYISTLIKTSTFCKTLTHARIFARTSQYK